MSIVAFCRGEIKITLNKHGPSRIFEIDVQLGFYKEANPCREQSVSNLQRIITKITVNITIKNVLITHKKQLPDVC